jgi:hypothetical protein
MDKIKDEIITTLTMQGINLDSTIEYEVNKKPYTLSYRFIIDSYMQGSDEAKLVFLTALKKSQSAGEMGIEKFFEGMGQLLLMGSLSKKL